MNYELRDYEPCQTSHEQLKRVILGLVTILYYIYATLSRPNTHNSQQPHHTSRHNKCNAMKMHSGKLEKRRMKDLIQMAKSRDLGALHYQSAVFKTNRIWRNAPKVIVSRIMGDYKNNTLGENILLYVSINRTTHLQLLFSRTPFPTHG